MGKTYAKTQGEKKKKASIPGNSPGNVSAHGMGIPPVGRMLRLFELSGLEKGPKLPQGQNMDADLDMKNCITRNRENQLGEFIPIAGRKQSHLGSGSLHKPSFHARSL